MKARKQKIFLGIGILSLVVLLTAIIMGMFINNQKTEDLDIEIARSMTYKRVQKGEENTNSEFVKFDAFFLRDLDGDGIAEGVRGTCREIGKEDTFYMELNVLTNGYLKDGQITINGNKNFYLQTAIVKDKHIKYNNISEDTQEIVLNTINSGTQKLMTGIVRTGAYTQESRKAEALRENIDNYSRINAITLTGIHVQEKEDGTTVETPIEKTVEFNVDWYGTTKTEIRNIEQQNTIEGIIDESNQEVSIEFTIETEEVNKQLILKKSYIEGTLPQFNGYNPTKVEITGIGIAYTYNKNTRKFTVQEEAIQRRITIASKSK